MPRLKKSDLCWAAGLIEGEGCLAATPRTGSLTLQLEVANTDYPLLSRMRRLFGGTVAKCAGRNNQAPYATWRISGHEAEKTVRAIEPHMTTGCRKRREARVWLGLRRTIGTRGKKTSPKVQADRERLLASLRTIRHKIDYRLRDFA